MSLLLPRSCSSPPWNSSSSSFLASELLICCQETQHCCHLQRPVWSFNAGALKYLLLDVAPCFGLPNSLVLTQKLYIAPAKTEYLPPTVQKHTGWLRDDWIHIWSNWKSTYLSAASSHYLQKSLLFKAPSSPLALTWFSSSSQQVSSVFTSPGALGTKTLLFTAVVEGNKHQIGHSSVKMLHPTDQMGLPFSHPPPARLSCPASSSAMRR